MHISTLYIPFHRPQQPSTFPANGADNKRLRDPEDTMEVKSDFANQMCSLPIASSRFKRITNAHIQLSSQQQRFYWHLLLKSDTFRRIELSDRAAHWAIGIGCA